MDNLLLARHSGFHDLLYFGFLSTISCSKQQKNARSKHSDRVELPQLTSQNKIPLLISPKWLMLKLQFYSWEMVNPAQVKFWEKIKADA